MAEDLLHPSKYATTLAADDLAETFALVAAYRSTAFESELRDIFPGRLALVDEIELAIAP